MLLSEILPLKLSIVGSDTLFDVSYLCVVYAYNDCPQMNQSHHLRMGLTSHLSDAYEKLSYFMLFFLFGAESDDDESDVSDDDGSVSRFTFGPCFSLYVELFSDRVICLLSSRVILNRVSIFLIFSRSSMFSICLSSSQVILNRVSTFLIFFALLYISRSNTFLVSNSESLINLRYANFSFFFSLSPRIAAILMSLRVGLQIPSWSDILVAAPPPL